MMYGKEYCEYLQTRSFLSRVYKRVFVYTRILSRTRGRVLDYGCGIGDLLSIKGKDIKGVDINEHCVNYCLEKGFDAVHVSDNNLPFPDNYFSTIILDNVYEHLDCFEDQFREIKRVLSDDGVLVVGVPGLKGHSVDRTHVRYYDENALVDSLSAHGCKKIEVFYTPIMKSAYLSKKLIIYVLWGLFEIQNM